VQIKKYVSLFLELAKIRIIFFVAVSTSIGFILASGNLITGMFLPTFGVFLLAGGSSALNHYQEREYDALMFRTKNRPIPSGEISNSTALIFAAFLILTGSAVIYLSSNLTAWILGVIALIWYNLIYTPLKRINSLAVIPGSVIGAIPPVIGWAATGRSIMEPEILALALFFFIWQIPHFWLLLLIHGEDYERAGYPSLTSVFDKSQLSRITYIWILALAISSLLIPLFSISSNIITGIILLFVGAYLAYSSRIILKNFSSVTVIRKSFMLINIYVLFVVILLTIDKLILTVI
jgi:protoheme IX farnesyltransferase